MPQDPNGITVPAVKEQFDWKKAYVCLAFQISEAYHYAAANGYIGDIPGLEESWDECQKILKEHL